MLLLLPKEILEYILSLVVYDRFIKVYPSLVGAGSQGEITNYLQTWRFYQVYRDSALSPLMRELSLVHPRIWKILVAATILMTTGFVSQKTWKFDERFFLTLNRTLEKK